MAKKSRKKSSGKKSSSATKKTIPAGTPPAKPVANTGGTFNIFPTTCYLRVNSGQGIDKMNAALRQIIFQIEKEQKSMTKSSIRGGHHSDRKIFEIDHWATKQLKSLIIAHCAEYIKTYWKNDSLSPLASMGNIDVYIGGWSMILRAGDMSAPHLHPKANISGSYYVSVPQIQGSGGQLVLCDPRTRAPVFPITDQRLSVQVTPQTGTLVMFPSYLEHYVTPFKGDGERMSIAFNIHFPKKMGGVAVTGEKNY